MARVQGKGGRRACGECEYSERQLHETHENPAALQIKERLLCKQLSNNIQNYEEVAGTHDLFTSFWTGTMNAFCVVFLYHLRKTT